ARQQLSARHMALAAGVRAAPRGLGDLFIKLVPQGAIVRVQRFESRTVAIDGGNQLGHAQGLGGFRAGGKPVRSPRDEISYICLSWPRFDRTRSPSPCPAPSRTRATAAPAGSP